MEVAINTNVTGDNTLVAAQATKGYRVRQLFLVPAGAVTVNFKSGATSLSGPLSLAANVLFVLDSAAQGWMTSAKNQALIINLGGAVQVSGRLIYDEVDL